MLDTIENIKMYKFLLKSKDFQKSYSDILVHLKSIDKIGKYKCKNVMDFSFAEVEELKDVISSNNIGKAISLLFGMDEKKVMNLRVIDFFKLAKKVNDVIVGIYNYEKSNYPAKRVTGDERLVKYGAFNLLKSIAEQFGKRPNEIETWNYGEVMLISKHNQDVNFIQEKMYSKNG